MYVAFARRYARRIALVGGWAALAIIVAATLSPISQRPTSSLPVNLERELAFAIVGFAFTLASPQRPLLLFGLLIACAGSLEWLQTSLPDRHGRLDDFVVKVIGVGAGVAVGTAVNFWARHFGKRSTARNSPPSNH